MSGSIQPLTCRERHIFLSQSALSLVVPLIMKVCGEHCVGVSPPSSQCLWAGWGLSLKHNTEGVMTRTWSNAAATAAACLQLATSPVKSLR